MTKKDKSFKEVFKPIVDEIVEESVVKLSQNDIDEIVNKLLPKLDEMIALRVRMHISLIVDAIKEKLKE